MPVPLSVEVSLVCVVVVWVEVVSGAEGCWLGEVDGLVGCCELVPGVVDCGELGDVCATAQTADNNRIAVIKDAFLITFLLYFRPSEFWPRQNGSSANGFRSCAHARVCLREGARAKKRELREFERVVACLC